MKHTKIQWTDETWNPIRGCSRVSAGCERCYAERDALRMSGAGGAYEGLLNQHGAWNGKIRVVAHKIEEPLRWRRPRRVFVNSMSDLFHWNVSTETLDDIFAVMAWADVHQFQILTKRPERMQSYLSDPHVEERVRNRAPGRWQWPLPNVWLGVSVENQSTADDRVQHLMRTPAAVRFVSAEPLLAPIVNLPPHHTMNEMGECVSWCEGCRRHGSGRIDWLIIGGESGPQARPCDVRWIRSLLHNAQAGGIAVFVKQLGAHIIDRNDAGWEGDLETLMDPETRKDTGIWSDPQAWPHTANPGPSQRFQGAPCRVLVRDRKGGNPEEWPQDLRVRKFPTNGGTP